MLYFGLLVSYGKHRRSKVLFFHGLTGLVALAACVNAGFSIRRSSRLSTFATLLVVF